MRWDRGPTAPDQAVLLDLPNRRFYFFFIEIWPQEVYYLTGLLILAAMTLFLMNAVAGRVWCGYLCPQTVWTDLFYAVERLIEGDRRERMKKDKSSDPMKLERISELVLKHSIWLYGSDEATLIETISQGRAGVMPAWEGRLDPATIKAMAVYVHSLGGGK